MKEEIKKHRNKIDMIDDEILKLLINRITISSEIVEKKVAGKLPVYNPEREKEILTRLLNTNNKKVSEDTIRFIFDKLFEESKKSAISDSNSSANVWEEFISSPTKIIAGPCSVESEIQILDLAETLSKKGIKFLRGGSFKPRTSPTSFQGLGFDGIKYLKQAAETYNMFTVTELLSKEQLINLYDYVDVIQIGSRMMSSFAYLKEVGKLTAKDKKPVLLKRGFGATLNEFVNAANYILNEGNDHVILCLRGIRTFEQIDSNMRFTPDLATILEIKTKTDLPILFDVSHSGGDRQYVKSLSSAALSLGADGLMVEVHISPEEALSDGQQSIEPKDLDEILEIIKKIKNNEK